MYNITPKTLFVGRKLIFLPTCHSTNDTATTLLKDEKVFEGTIVVTSNQTAGRGQRGNQWEAEASKNLTFSLILNPTFLTASEQFQLNIAISLGSHDFLKIYYPTEYPIKIKWPNDLYHKDKKIGGILIENILKRYTIEHSVIGIGINVNQSNFTESKAVSMKLASEQPNDFDLTILLTELAQCLEQNYLLLRNGGLEVMKSRYLQHLYWYQEQHTFRGQAHLFEGKIVGIDAIGRLALETQGIIQYFGLKEIEFIE
ncbi:MAG: biotin--[acetyl-CoA-carboxylase] ligase [Bacteroidota bacterium]